jgi:hypothetical protein
MLEFGIKNNAANGIRLQDKPPIKEPPNEPQKPPVEEPPPKDPDLEPPRKPPMKVQRFKGSRFIGSGFYSGKKWSCCQDNGNPSVFLNRTFKLSKL